jgi:hypothetical protein
MSGDFILAISDTEPPVIVRGRAEFNTGYLSVKTWLLHNYDGYVSEINDELVMRTTRIFRIILGASQYGMRRWNETIHSYEFIFVYNIGKHYLSSKQNMYSKLFTGGDHLKVSKEWRIWYEGYNLLDIIFSRETYESFINEWSKLLTLPKLLSTITLISRILLANSEYHYEFPREITEKIVCHMYDTA